MFQKKIIAVISAYGLMTDSDNRYRVLILADNIAEFAGKFKTFLCSETVKAMSTPEISKKLGIINPSKVYEAISRVSYPEREGDREVISIPELCTDYHIENPNLIIGQSSNDDMSKWKKAVILTDCWQETCRTTEFPDVLAILDRSLDIDEEGNPILITHSDGGDGTVVMTNSDLCCHLMGWNSYIVPIM